MTQATTSATYKTLVTADLPDFGSRDITFRLVAAFFNAAGEEVIDGKTYTMTLDASGVDDGSFYLPTPDNTGAAGANWFVTLPSGYEDIVTVAYSGTAQAVSDLLAAGATTADPDVITATLAGKASKVSGATTGNLASLTSGGDLADSGYAAADFDAAGSAAAAQAAAIASLGGADGTVTDEQLRNWAGRALALMTSVTRTNYSKSWIGTDGRTKYASWIQVTGTVTWPDGVTGHLDGVEYPEEPGVLQYCTVSHAASGKIAIKHPRFLGVSLTGVVTPDYYVDSAAAGGGDGSLATPYNTLAALSAGETLTAGDVIALKSGSTFYESIDFSDGVGIGVYRCGAGSKPVLDARDTIAAGSWSLYGAGAGSTYSAAVTWDGGSGIESFGVWQDGVRMTKGGSAITLNAGEYFIADPTTGSGTLYVRAAGDADLSAGAKTISHMARYGGLASDIGTGVQIDGMVFDGIRCIGNTSPSGSITAGRNSIFRHCAADEGSKHNYYYKSGSKLYGCTASEAYNGASTGVMFIGNDDNGDSLGLSLYDCYAACATYSVAISGFGFHAGAVGNSFGTVNHIRCIGKNLGYFVSNTSDCTTANFENVAADGCTFGLAFSEVGATYNIDGFYFVANLTNMIPVSMATNGLIVNIVNMYYQTDTGTLTTGAINIGNATPTLTLKDSSFYFNNTSGNRRGIDCRNAGATITSTRNRFAGSATGQTFPYYFTVNPTYTTDWNIFKRADLNFYINSTLYATVAAYKAATSKDLLSIVADI